MIIIIRFTVFWKKKKTAMTTMKIQLLSIFLALFISAGCARDAKKIIMGNYASIKELPHQVSLQSPEGSFLCGGTIIDSTHILTAAHCLVDKNLASRYKNIQVVTGINDKFARTPYNVFNVIKQFCHAEYTPSDSHRNDIAILTLDRPIPFNTNQKPAKRPKADTPVSTRVIASGWGSTVWNSQTEKSEGAPQFLQKIEGTVISSEECQVALNARIYPGQICVRSGSRGGTCFGDSGGPLTLNGQVVGITSWGEPCGRGYPDVFTRVYHYLDWIQTAISQ